MLFADGEGISIFLHVSSICERQEYRELPTKDKFNGLYLSE